MDFNLKCLCLYIVFLWTLSVSYCQKSQALRGVSYNSDSDNAAKAHSIQKRTVPEDDANLKGPDSETWQKRAWPFIMSGGKRRWIGLNSWGKRHWLNSGGKRRWSTLGSWGKRSDMNLDNNDEADLDGADWNTFVARSMPVGGEMSDIGNAVNPFEGIESDIDKRRWSAMSSWGKRGSSDIDDISNNALDNTISNTMDKRKWSSFRSWGKRDAMDDGPISNLKRRWSALSSWGKRDGMDGLLSSEKRRWNALGSWGKRAGRWNSFRAWGKRSDASDNVDEPGFSSSNNPHTET